MKRLISGMLIYFFFSMAASALTFDVDKTFDAIDAAPGDGVCQTTDGNCSLRAAIQEANAYPGKDVINLPAGTYKASLGNPDEDAGAEGDWDITDDLDIIGAGTDQTIITGAVNQYRIFHILPDENDRSPTVLISNLKLTKAIEDTKGAVVYNKESDLTLDSVLITEAGKDSSAIYNYQGQLAVLNSTLQDNDQAITSYSGTNVIDSCEFQGNGKEPNTYGTLQGSGAAIYATSRSWTAIENSVFKINQARTGGALYLSGTAYIHASTFDENVASGYAGAIYSSALLRISESLFSNNRVDDTGYYNGGGALYLYGSTFIVDSSFQSNQGEGPYSDGGAIYVGNNESYFIQRCDFAGNEVSLDGGAIYHEYGYATTRVIEDSSFSANIAGSSGGALFMYGDIVVANTLIAGNTADYGGGVYSKGDLNRIENTTISGNTALVSGGGLYNESFQDGDKVDLKNVTIANNSAPVGHGGNITNAEGRVRLLTTVVSAAQNGQNCEGDITSLGYNIDSDNSCALSEDGDQSGVNPQIAALDDNGGRSHTHALGDGSPAINAVIVEHCEDVDQRFFYRRDGGRCDIGAYEHGSTRAQSGSVGYSVANFEVNEPDATATIVLSRTGGSQGTVSTYYFDTLAGTANSSDYSFDWDTVVWGDGDATDKTFEVSVRDDSYEEGLESVILGLFYADGGASFSANSVSELTIVDDDVHYGAMRFSATTYVARESEGVLNVTIERSGGSFGEVTVDYNTEDASATAGADYEPVSGTLTFGFDETEKTISIPIISDGVQEGDETFKLNLSNPTRGATLGFPALSTVTIKGNDNEGADSGGTGTGGTGTGGTGTGGTGTGGTGTGGTGTGGTGTGGTESGGSTGVAGDSGSSSSGGGPLAPLSLLALLGLSYFRQSLGC